MRRSQTYRRRGRAGRQPARPHIQVPVAGAVRVKRRPPDADIRACSQEPALFMCGEVSVLQAWIDRAPLANCRREAARPGPHQTAAPGWRQQARPSSCIGGHRVSP